MAAYEVFETGRAPVKAWVEGVPVEEVARCQLFARELAEHGLQNAKQLDDGPVPQRHKRRRKRS